MSTDQSSKQGCIACKHQRRKCREDCLLKPYFGSNSSQDFQAAQKIFGISNMNKILKEIRVEDRPKAIESLVWEASIWKQDPVNGPLGHFTRLQQENLLLKNQLNFHLQNLRQYSAPQLGFQELNNNGVGILPTYKNNLGTNSVNFQSTGGLRPPVLQGHDRFGCLTGLYGLQGFESRNQRGNFNISRQNFDNVGLGLNRVRGRGFQYPISHHHNQNQYDGQEGRQIQSDVNNVNFRNMQQFPSPAQQLQDLYDNKCIEGQSSNANTEIVGDKILPICTSSANY